MNEPLSIYIRRFLKDPAEFERALRSPVMLFEPPEHDDGETTDYRMKTVSGIGGPGAHGEPFVALIRKQAANAFQHRITVGRTTNNDIVIDDPSVSRFHAWFEELESGWSVADAGSKNGTLLNGKKLTSKKLVPVPIGARLKIGDVPATFHSAEAFLALLKAASKK